MKNLTIPALALAAFAVPAVADTTSNMAIDPANMIIADDIDGGEIYTDLSDVPWKEDGPIDAALDSWQSIGEIEDIVLNQDGQMVGIVADVGGFLGIGDKHVLLPMENVRIVALAEGDDNYALVTRHSEESLMEMPEVEKGLFD